MAAVDLDDAPARGVSGLRWLVWGALILAALAYGFAFGWVGNEIHPLPVDGAEADGYAGRADALRTGGYRFNGFHPVGYDALLAGVGWLLGLPGVLAAPWLGALALLAIAGSMVALLLDRPDGRRVAGWVGVAAALALLANPVLITFGMRAVSDVVYTAITCVFVWLAARRRPVRWRSALMLGLLAGWSWLVRTQGIALVAALGCIWWWRARSPRAGAAMAGGWLLGALPQLVLAWWATGNPFHNRSAGNLAWKVLYDFGPVPEGTQLPGSGAILLERPGDVLAGTAGDLWELLTHAVPASLQGGGEPVAGLALMVVGVMGAGVLMRRAPLAAGIPLLVAGLHLGVVALMLEPRPRMTLAVLPFAVLFAAVGAAAMGGWVGGWLGRVRSAGPAGHPVASRVGAILALSPLVLLPAVGIPSALERFAGQCPRSALVAMPRLDRMEPPVLALLGVSNGLGPLGQSHYQTIPANLLASPDPVQLAQTMRTATTRFGLRHVALFAGPVRPDLLARAAAAAPALGWQVLDVAPGAFVARTPLRSGWRWIDGLRAEPGAAGGWEVGLPGEAAPQVATLTAWVRAGDRRVVARPLTPLGGLRHHLAGDPSWSAPIWWQPVVELRDGRRLAGEVTRLR